MATNFEKLIENADSTQVFKAMNEILRKRNAEKFIDSLNKNFNESQKESFINILCEYEEFLEKINK